jgi:serine/threonine protein kinase
VFAEMVEKKALFKGDSEIGQLFEIFKVLGTPEKSDVPFLTELPEWNDVFPRFRKQGLETKVPTLCVEGLDLLGRMLDYHEFNRISAIDALNHPYFNDIDRSQFNISSLSSS